MRSVDSSFDTQHSHARSIIYMSNARMPGIQCVHEIRGNLFRPFLFAILDRSVSRLRHSDDAAEQ